MKQTKLANELEIRDAVRLIRAALDLGGPYRPNIWAFYSSKNNALLTVLGDVTFIQTILLEGDPDVISYRLGSSIFSSNDTKNNIEGTREIHVFRKHGKPQWILCGRFEHLIKAPTDAKRRQLSEQKKAAEGVGSIFEVHTERDFADRMIEFSNWLTLCSAMTRAHDFACCREAEVLTALLATANAILIGEALKANEIDPALMLAAIGRGIANGIIKCNLTKQQLTANTPISRQQGNLPLTYPLQSRSGTLSVSEVSAEVIPRNRRTSCIPELWSDLNKWPKPVPELVAEKDAYNRREQAIRMYIQNSSYESITQETGLSPSWVRKLFARCLLPTSDGAIYGFGALVKFNHLFAYHRTAPPPIAVINKVGKQGFSGAFVQLLTTFNDDLLNLIEEHLLKIKPKDHVKIGEAKIKWVSLKEAVHNFLRREGLSDADYPFNTKDQGYNALINFCRQILYKKPIPYILARYGKNAAKRAQIGTGIPSLIQPVGHFKIMQLDFHKHDTVAIVEIERPNGDPIDAHVPRWWLGALVDTYSNAVIGLSDSFESQTTESCVLDLIESAIAPQPHLSDEHRFAVNNDGCWLPNQLLPSLAFNGWDVLKLDRAWAHKSTNVISAIVATVGCAICFGRTREWWSRALVEHTFAQLTQLGAQCLPSTTGTGPNDPRRTKPESEALKYRFRQDDICDIAKANARWINEDAKEGNFFSRPLHVLRNAVSRGANNYFPAPLPKDRHRDRPTMWITIRCKVEGNPARGIAPYVRSKRCGFRGPELASAWHLIGQQVFLQVLRRDMRRARIVIERTGEIISNVNPDKRWLSSIISWRNFCLIQSSGLQQRLHSRPPEAIPEFLTRRGAELEKSRKNGKAQQRLANLMASVSRDIKSNQKQLADKVKKERTNKNNNSEAHESPLGLFGSSPLVKSYTKNG